MGARRSRDPITKFLAEFANRRVVCHKTPAQKVRGEVSVGVDPEPAGGSSIGLRRILRLFAPPFQTNTGWDIFRLPRPNNSRPFDSRRSDKGAFLLRPRAPYQSAAQALVTFRSGRAISPTTGLFGQIGDRAVIDDPGFLIRFLVCRFFFLDRFETGSGRPLISWASQ
jgi:hypothetical protein